MPISKPYITEVAGQELMLFAERVAFIVEYRTLLVADAHLGKANHFRKHGIAVPHGAEDESLNRLAAILNATKPDRLVFMGDLFHSHLNRSWERFEIFLGEYIQCETLLVKGNHDILPEQLFTNARLTVVESMELGPFLLTHDKTDSHLYNIHGHIHPAVRLRGLGRSSLKLPCFIFGERSAILPSFGAFTGHASVRPRKSDRVFLINGPSITDMSASVA